MNDETVVSELPCRVCPHNGSNGIFLPKGQQCLFFGEEKCSLDFLSSDGWNHPSGSDEMFFKEVEEDAPGPFASFLQSQEMIFGNVADAEEAIRQGMIKLPASVMPVFCYEAGRWNGRGPHKTKEALVNAVKDGLAISPPSQVLVYPSWCAI